MGGFLIAWIVGMGMSLAQEEWLAKRQAQNVRAQVLPANNPGINPFPPKPGRMAIASGLYAGLAILAEAPSMRSTATLLAWGYNVAIAMNFATRLANAQGSGTQSSGLWDPPVAPDTQVFPAGVSNSDFRTSSTPAPPTAAPGPPRVA